MFFKSEIFPEAGFWPFPQASSGLTVGSHTTLADLGQMILASRLVAMARFLNSDDIGQ